MTKEEEKIVSTWESFMRKMYLLGYVKFSKALRKQIEPILANLESSKSIALVSGFTTQLITTYAIEEAYKPFIISVSDRGAKVFARSLRLPDKTSIAVGFGNEVFKQNMIEYLNTIGSQHIVDITETTRKLVNKALADGLAEGDTIRQVAKRIERYTLGGLGKNKARPLLIAKTEALMASGIGKDIQAEQYPYVMVKNWVHGHPKKPRSQHEEAVKDKKSMGDNWTLYGRTMRYAGDSKGGAINNCNCQCSTIYKPKEDSEGNLIRKN